MTGHKEGPPPQPPPGQKGEESDADRIADVFLTVFGVWVLLLALMMVRGGAG